MLSLAGDSGDYGKTRFQRNLSFLINSKVSYLNFAVLVDWNVNKRFLKPDQTAKHRFLEYIRRIHKQ